MRLGRTQKNCIIIGLLAVLLFCLSLTIGYAILYDGYLLNASDGTFAFGGREYSVSDKPFTYCKVSYAPIEECLKHVGFGFGWNSERGTYVITDGDATYEVKNESRTVLKNGAEYALSMPIKMRDGKYYAPAEFFEKMMGKKFIFQGRIRDKYVDKLIFVPHSNYFFLNSTRFEMPDTVMQYNGEAFFPANAVLEAMGFSLGWDTDKNGLEVCRSSLREVIADGSAALKAAGGDSSVSADAFMFHNLYYVSENSLKGLTDVNISVEGKLEDCPLYKRDLLQDTVVPDDFRINAPVVFYKGCCTVGNMAMEILGINQNDAKSYAGVVNALAESLPNVTTYSIVVPNSAEFYAPKHKASKLTNGIKTIYENLSDKVVPINAVKPLGEHAGEKLYFSTDHHWTQRGAYYAYRALNDYRGYKTPDLSELKTDHVSGFVGSFAGFMKGTPGETLCRSNPDLLERFLPQTEVSGEAFSDMNLKKSLGKVYAIDKRYNTYMTFISGDRPISRFTTSNKNGKSALIIKESYGNAFATFAMNDYETVYVLDPREFNGFAGKTEKFNLVSFYNAHPFDDLIVINYPVGMTSGLRQAIYNLIQ